MREFMILISEVLFVVILQTIVEAVLEMQERKQYAKIVNIASIVICYLLLIRYAFNHIFPEIASIVGVWL